MTFAVEFSTAWRRLGFERNEMRLGFVTLWWCAGSLSNELSRVRIVLAEAAHELRKPQRLNTNTEGNTR
jgi:hypothetical protein